VRIDGNSDSKPDGGHSLAPSDSTRGSLISRARQHQPQAWNELVDLFGPLIAYWCRHRGLDAFATADCVQEVFAAVYRKLETFRPQRSSGSFRSWLWTITANKIRDSNRERQRYPASEGGSSALHRLHQIPACDVQLDQDQPMNDSALQQLTHRAIEQIRSEFEPRTWSIFQRCVVDEVATADVAQEFGISPAAIRQVRSRILRRLREQLGDVI
jgi:RNA polymerase sigma-70 factor (ECF subfamily)